MAVSTALAPADLTAITAFAGLPAATLEWLLAHGEGRTAADGETVFEPGAPAELMTAIIRGGIQFYAVKGARATPFSASRPDR